MLDRCDVCGKNISGALDGGCEVCDFILCSSCAGAHPAGACDGSGRSRGLIAGRAG